MKKYNDQYTKGLEIADKFVKETFNYITQPEDCRWAQLVATEENETWIEEGTISFNEGDEEGRPEGLISINYRYGDLVNFICIQVPVDEFVDTFKEIREHAKRLHEIRDRFGKKEEPAW